MKPLKWTNESAAREFRVAPVALSKYLRQAGITGDGAGCYSTEQICQAVFGDLRAERLRKEQQLTRRYQLENEIMESHFLDRAALTKGFAQLADAMTSIILRSGLTREEKENLQRELAGVPIIYENVARSQTQLRRSKKNGQKLAEDE
jgi:hypothetical protein